MRWLRKFIFSPIPFGHFTAAKRHVLPEIFNSIHWGSIHWGSIHCGSKQ